MNATVFDTDRTVKCLKEAGFSDIQAETVTDVLSESRSVDVSDLATKADFALMRSDLSKLVTEADLKTDLSDFVTKSDLKTALSDYATKTDLKAELAVLRTELSDLKADIFKWAVPLLLGQAALIATLVKLLLRAMQRLPIAGETNPPSLAGTGAVCSLCAGLNAGPR